MKKRTMKMIEERLDMLENLKVTMHVDQDPFDKIMLIETRIDELKNLINIINLSERTE